MSGILTPRGVGFRSVKNLINRFNVNRETERNELISIDDIDLPSWQRQVVWTEIEKGLLAYSLLKRYPIGLIILWKMPNGIRVPIDGRQRLTAIREFYEGKIAVPNLASVDPELRNRKYRLLEGDSQKGIQELTAAQKDIIDDYELSLTQYEDIDEKTAMDIFVMLQGGKSLTKTEVRAALGGLLCDFVTDLTTEPITDIDDDLEEGPPSRHQFFNDLANNIPNSRKAHRNICDLLLHEFLYPGQDKHWTSLESMYREKAENFSEQDKSNFRKILSRFHRAMMIELDEVKIIAPQIRSAHLIVSIFKAWREIDERYDTPESFSFIDAVREFETIRAELPDESPWINFTAALSNAGYAKNRLDARHDILMAFILKTFPNLTLKDRDRRTFTIEQKIAIWEKAEHQCEWVEDGGRCDSVFENPRKADADHIVMWKDGGPTTVENGRLLCQKHNRGRK